MGFEDPGNKMRVLCRDSYNYEIQPFENAANSLYTIKKNKNKPKKKTKKQAIDHVRATGHSLLISVPKQGRDYRQITLKSVFYKLGVFF